MSQSSYYEEEDYTSEVNNKILGRILSLLKPHWKWVIGFLLMISMVSILDSYFTYLGKQVIDEGILKSDTPAVYRFAAIYVSLILVQSMAVFGFIYMVGILGERIRYNLRQRMFNHLQELSLSYFSRTPVGWIMARVTSDTERVSDLMTWGLLDVTWGIVNIASGMYFMVMINWRLALVVLAALPILIYVAIIFRTRILTQYRIVRKNNSKITGAYNENITGVRVVKGLVRENANLQEFSALTSNMYGAAYKAAWLSALFLPTVQIISSSILAVIIIWGGFQIPTGFITIGGIQAFISYITFIMWPVQDMARIYAEMQHAVASAERIFTLIDAKPEITDRNNALHPKSIQGSIEFDHVSFYYEDEKPVIQDITFQVKQGETIALVGPTGGGKTTLVNLLCRFYEPKKGVIRIGGRDYTELSTFAIQSRIGMVLQTPHLFSGTIFENIQYGRLNATRAEVESAAKLAGAHEFINKFEKNYDTEVGEGGNLLSVGQKQLISLARAVLANPEIFIMDEATSSVDTLTEALIQQGMEALMKGRTSFIIAHRLSTIKRADRILVIQEGRIVEMGSHAELLRLKGHYYRLYTKQFRHEREAIYDPFMDGNQAQPAH